MSQSKHLSSFYNMLLEKKYGVKANFVRMHASVNDFSQFDAVLLIGDEALKANKSGLLGFDLVFDLAKEWYDWQKMPFVFAVWAHKKTLPAEKKEELQHIILQSLEKSENQLESIGTLHGRMITLSPTETSEYLQGFNYRLGEREKEAMNIFKKFIEEVVVIS